MSTFVDDSAPRIPLDESLRRLKTLVSPLTGIVKNYWEAPGNPDDARIVQYFCLSANTAELVGYAVDPYNGSAGIEREAVIASALGEAIERYCGAAVPPELTEPLTARELGDAAIAPEAFSLFAPSQYALPDFPYQPFTADTPVRWVRAVRLTDGRPMYAPAQLVYLRPAGAADEVPIGYATSSGMACGATREAALLSGAFEVVERDAFMLTWLNAISRPLLTWDDHPGLLREEQLHFAPAGLAYSVVDLSIYAQVPTAMCLVRDEYDIAALSVGAASAATIERAWQKAVVEAFQTRTWSRRERNTSGTREFRADFTDIRTFGDHVALYSHAKHRHHADFLDASPERVSVRSIEALRGETPGAQLCDLVARAGRAGATLYAIDVTTPDVRTAGLFVVKVLAPEFVPLYASYNRRFLGGRRLYSAPVELGLADAPRTIDTLNPAPHPFP